MIYMWNLKYDTNELIYKTETDSQTQRTGEEMVQYTMEKYAV